ncbi:hypothetical protein GE21DRAFT_1021175 [Neurospora crassa]|nr:hypothetical protein GE21DRAFT_1021175 [Neurospora crassa]
MIHNTSLWFAVLISGAFLGRRRQACLPACLPACLRWNSFGDTTVWHSSGRVGRDVRAREENKRYSSLEDANRNRIQGPFRSSHSAGLGAMGAMITTRGHCAPTAFCESDARLWLMGALKRALWDVYAKALRNSRLTIPRYRRERYSSMVSVSDPFAW